MNRRLPGYLNNLSWSISRILLLIILLTGCSGRNVGLPSATQLPLQPASQETHLPPSHANPTQTAKQSPEPLDLAALRPEVLEALPDLSSAPRYQISIDLDYSRARFTGRAQISYTNAETIVLDRLYLRLLPNGGGSYAGGGLSVSEATIEGQPVPMLLSLSDSVLELQLPSQLQPGQRSSIDLAFSGQVPQDFGDSGPSSGYGIYNLSEGVLALAGWYPMLAVYDEDGWNLDPVSSIGDSVYSDIAFYNVDLSMPANLVLVSSGVVTGESSDGDIRRLSISSGPVREFAMIASPDFQLESTNIDGVTLNSYSLPGYAEPGKQVLQVAASSLEIFEGHFGAYPYVELDIVAAPIRYASAVEFPGIVLIGSHLYDDPDDPQLTVATAHEVAHQWWYNVVGNDVFEDPWMDEALTTYSSSLYYEYSGYPAAARGLIQYWQNQLDGLIERDLDDQVAQSLAYFENLGQARVYGGVVYSKGALFFKALREQVGDQAFFQALQGYYQEHYFQIARPEHLLGVFEVSSGQELDDFYNQWLYSPVR